MDLNAIKPQENILDIVHPATGEKLGIRVGIVSIEDEKLKKLKRAIRDERIKLEQRGKTFDAAREDKNLNVMLFHTMTFWEWDKDANFNGEKPTFNQENVCKVFDELSWFRSQVAEYAGEEKNFFQK